MPILVMLVLALAAAPAVAQQPPPPTLDPVVVEGTRVPPERTATEQEAREELMARVPERGTRLERVARLDGGETCVCCRVSLSGGPGDATAVLWRKVFADDVRDVVVSRSSDGGRTFAPATIVHADGWKISACPHRGGRPAPHARGRPDGRLAAGHGPARSQSRSPGRRRADRGPGDPSQGRQGWRGNRRRRAA